MNTRDCPHGCQRGKCPECECVALRGERDALSRDIRAETDGRLDLRRRFGARENETMEMWIARLFAAEKAMEKVRSLWTKRPYICDHGAMLEWVEALGREIAALLRPTAPPEEVAEEPEEPRESEADALLRECHGFILGVTDRREDERTPYETRLLANIRTYLRTRPAPDARDEALEEAAKRVFALACILCEKGIDYQESTDPTLDGGHVPGVGIGELDECEAEAYRQAFRALKSTRPGGGG